jgi:UDP-glucose 4-epimerase
MPARVVIVGAGGFVGGAIASRLAQDGAAVLGLTRNEVDLLQPDAGKKLGTALRADDCIVFVSAIAPARNAESLMKNLVMAEQVIAALKARSVAHVVYVSSDAVYDENANPVTERSCCQPSSMHGMMHAARELMLKSELTLPIAIVRPSLLYGENDPHNGYGPNRFRRLAEKGDPITLFGEGEEQRDHVYIDDVAKLVAEVIMHRSTGVLNIATGSSVSFRNVAELVVEISGKRAEIRGTPRQNPITHRHFDITECLKAFPRFRYRPLGEGLARAAQAGRGAVS